MTPMIDVVFLLIIFFLVSSHLAKRETRVPMELPIAGSHQIDDVAVNRITINVDRDQRIQMGGTIVTADRVAEFLANYERQNNSVAAVRIRTDKTVPYGAVEPLLRNIAQAGIVDITFAVHETK
jgi:biopolymer transport protein ExbD